MNETSRTTLEKLRESLKKGKKVEMPKLKPKPKPKIKKPENLEDNYTLIHFSRVLKTTYYDNGEAKWYLLQFSPDNKSGVPARLVRKMNDIRGTCYVWNAMKEIASLSALSEEYKVDEGIVQEVQEGDGVGYDDNEDDYLEDEIPF